MLSLGTIVHTNLGSSGNLAVLACGVVGGLLIVTLLLFFVYNAKRKHSKARVASPDEVSKWKFMVSAIKRFKSVEPELNVSIRAGPCRASTASALSWQADLHCSESRVSVVSLGLSPTPSRSNGVENWSDEDGRGLANNIGQASVYLQTDSGAPSRRCSLRQLLEEPYITTGWPAEVQTQTKLMSMKSNLSGQESNECRERLKDDYILACEQALQMSNVEAEGDFSSADLASRRPSLMAVARERQVQVVSAKDGTELQTQTKSMFMKSNLSEQERNESRERLKDDYILACEQALQMSNVEAEGEFSSADLASRRPSLMAVARERQVQVVSAKDGTELQTQTKSMAMKSNLAEQERNERRERLKNDYILACEQAVQMSNVEPECEFSSADLAPEHPSLMAVARERQVQVVSAKDGTDLDKVVFFEEDHGKE